MAKEKEFKTLRGFLKGSEPDEELYFAYCACLRIFGENVNFNEINERLSLAPTTFHKKGDFMGKSKIRFKDSMWSYQAPLPETEPLENHIHALWEKIRPHKEFLKGLKRNLTVDVFLGYRSNCDMAGVEVSYKALQMFVELEIPFGISITIA